MTTRSHSFRLSRLIWMLGIVLALLFWAAPRAAAEDYDTTLDKLGRLQDLATEYAAEHDGDPILLTLSYTRTGSYNTSMWQLTAGGRDTEFDAYVAEQDAELSSLQGMKIREGEALHHIPFLPCLRPATITMDILHTNSKGQRKWKTTV